MLKYDASTTAASTAQNSAFVATAVAMATTPATKSKNVDTLNITVTFFFCIFFKLYGIFLRNNPIRKLKDWRYMHVKHNNSSKLKYCDKLIAVL